MILSKTAKEARARTRRKIKKMAYAKGKWPEQWFTDYAVHQRGPLLKLKHQLHELQLIMFNLNSKEGWLHERDDSNVSLISERSREIADGAYRLNDDFFK